MSRAARAEVFFKVILWKHLFSSPENQCIKLEKISCKVITIQCEPTAGRTLNAAGPILHTPETTFLSSAPRSTCARTAQRRAVCTNPVQKRNGGQGRSSLDHQCHLVSPGSQSKAAASWAPHRPPPCRRQRGRPRAGRASRSRDVAAPVSAQARGAAAPGDSALRGQSASPVCLTPRGSPLLKREGRSQESSQVRLPSLQALPSTYEH